MRSTQTVTMKLCWPAAALLDGMVARLKGTVHLNGAFKERTAGFGAVKE